MLSWGEQSSASHSRPFFRGGRAPLIRTERRGRAPPRSRPPPGYVFRSPSFGRTDSSSTPCRFGVPPSPPVGRVWARGKRAGL